MVALFVVGAGGVLLWLSGLDWFKHHAALQTLVTQFGGLLIVGVGLALLWEWFGRRALAREILAAARVGADVSAAGIDRIGTAYLDDVDWADLFQGVEKLDIVFAYGATWRGANNARLRTVAARSGTRLHVYLPDPEDVTNIATMATRFAMDPDELKRRIIEARAEFESFRVEGGGEVKVFYRSGDHVFSCYRFDNTAVLTLYSHRRARADVPTLVCRNGGTLYEFIRAELRAIADQSFPADGAQPPERASQRPKRLAFLNRWLP